MTNFFNKIFTRYPIKTRRLLELFPGFAVWTLILFPIWGSFFIPTLLAYFILFFDVYWLYKSFSLVRTSYSSSKKIKSAEKEDWFEKSKKFKDVLKVNHVLVIPNYKETASKVRVTLNALSKQSFPIKNLHIVLAMEEREPEAKERATILIKQFNHIFTKILSKSLSKSSGFISLLIIIK